MPPRPRVQPTDDWRQIELSARAPGQRTYELIRSVVLFGQSPAERAAETGAAQRTLYRPGRPRPTPARRRTPPQSLGTGTSLTGVIVAVHRLKPGKRNFWSAFTSSASTM